jgi:TorA maturation chaperone TorD
MQADELPSISDDAAVRVARECVYRFLSAALTDPTMPAWERVLEPGNQDLAAQAGDLLRAEFENRPLALACGELAPVNLDLTTLIAELNAMSDQVRSDYERVYGLVVPKECPPYETEYHPPAQAFMRAQQLADIAGFYRAFGLATPSACPERPDHIVLELEFMAVLLAKERIALAGADAHPEAREQAETCALAQRAFLRDHLCWWATAFAAGLRRKAGSGYLHEIGCVLAALVPAERHLLGVDPPFQTSPLPHLIERPEEETACETCPLLAEAGPG